MNKPLIALTSQYSDDNEKMQMRSRYFNIITICGGIPIPLPQLFDKSDIKQLAEKFDGFLFSGGDDVNPQLYDEEIQPECGFISDERDTFEIALLHEVMRLNKPIFAICRGIQIINVALGGSLYQHIDGHSRVRHDIITNDGKKINVNSYHHQAVKDAASCLNVTARDESGYVEALDMPNYRYFKAVQWHPEILTDDDRDFYLKSITEFIDSCKVN